MIASSTGARNLVALAGSLAGGTARAEELAAMMLGVPELEEADGGRSNLNDDGCPLQLSLSATASGCRYRLIADPAFLVPDARERLTRAREIAASVFVRGGAAELLPACDSAIDELLLDPGADLDGFDGGAIWLGAGVNEAGCAMYVLGGPEDNAAWWSRAAAWLAKTLPDPETALRDLERLRRHRFAWVSVEGQSIADARAKLYWRLGGELREEEPDVPLLGELSLRSFAHAMLDGRDVSPRGVVFSAGYRLGSGAAHDVKIDVCGHCAARPPDEWSRLVAVCADAFGIDDAPLQAALATPGMSVSFLGLGRTTGGEHRLNLYLNRN